MTNRLLKTNEVFEVRLDKMVSKWAGSIEIGVTTHAPNSLDFPSTMTNIRSGTWMMTGNGVMHNGTTVIDDYGVNLDKLRVGDWIRSIDGHQVSGDHDKARETDIKNEYQNIFYLLLNK